MPMGREPIVEDEIYDIHEGGYACLSASKELGEKFFGDVVIENI